MTTTRAPFRKTASAAAHAAATPPIEALEQALCAQVDPEQWFPERGEPNHAAKAICWRCPVRQACLDFAMTTETADHHRFGIWGGYSAIERTRLARRTSTNEGEAA